MDKPTILYVDDEIINLELFEANLEKKYNVLLAKSGANGLEILESRNDVQVVISDMKMPNMSGIEFISIAKEKYPSIKYYILTGYDITREIREALNEGLIIKYFRKPFNMNDIDSEIEKVIGI
jgi:two-component system, response regulator, stage 0 sporulation protein F